MLGNVPTVIGCEDILPETEAHNLASLSRHEESLGPAVEKAGRFFRGTGRAGRVGRVAGWGRSLPPDNFICSNGRIFCQF